MSVKMAKSKILHELRARAKKPDAKAGGSLMKVSPLPKSNDPASQVLPSTRVELSFLDKDTALKQLTHEQANTIRSYLPDGESNITAAVDGAYAAAVARQEECRSKRWRWKINGRTIILQDEASKVLRWLDRFKAVGDVIANVDPIHIGLPWAGIWLLLSVATAGVEETAALLTGIDMALSMANRLKVYVEYYSRLPAALATSNLEAAMQRIYVALLRFFAEAMGVYEQNILLRTWKLFWQPSGLISFETECDSLGSRLEIETSNCDREIQSRQHTESVRWRADLDGKLQALADIKRMTNSIDALQEKLDLQSLKIVQDASYDSFLEGSLAECLEGTRVELISDVLNWSVRANGKRIFWLCGMAGTGKSTISRTLARVWDKDQRRLGASFFFKKGEGDRGNARYFFPTIAAQLASKIPGMMQGITEALTEDPHLCDKNLKDQFKGLLKRPLQQAIQRDPSCCDLVIVMDAMDECEPGEDIRRILNIIAEANDSTLRLRMFLTSRSELYVRLGFNDMSRTLYDDIKLETVEPLTIENDIRTVLQHRLAQIGNDSRSSARFDPIPENWPGAEAIEILVQLTAPLFIVASTICAYVAERSAQTRLKTILDLQVHAPVSKIAKIYIPILEHVLEDVDEAEHDSVTQDIREIIGPLVLLANSLSARSLSNILRIPLGDIDDRLNGFHSVLRIPDSADIPIRLLHLSFRDFLVDPKFSKANRFFVDEAATHGILSERCIRYLGQPGILKQDICDVVKPGFKRVTIAQKRLAKCIPADTAYACLYWINHTVKSNNVLVDGSYVHRFLREKFLEWLEALGWLGKLSGAITSLRSLRPRVKVEEGEKLLGFIDDAIRFVHRHRPSIDLAPLQLYSSALIYTPTASVVRKIFKTLIPAWIVRLPTMPTQWDSVLQRVEHGSPIYDLQFSPKGKIVALASGSIVHLQDIFTGEVIDQLEGHEQLVMSLAFSADGEVIASACNNAIRTWNPETCDLLHLIEGAHSVVFSPVGSVMAFTSIDGQTICVQRTQLSPSIEKFEDTGGVIRALTFSVDGRILISVSDDAVVLWDIETGAKGREIGKLRGLRPVAVNCFRWLEAEIVAVSLYMRHMKLFNLATGEELAIAEMSDALKVSVPTSKDNHMLGAFSDRGSISLWDCTTGLKVMHLESCENYIQCIGISPDGKILGSIVGAILSLRDLSTMKKSASTIDQDVRVRHLVSSGNHELIASAAGHIISLWDTKTGHEVKRLVGHGQRVLSLSFSPSAKVLASASMDHSARLWDVASGETICRLEGHSRPVRLCVFSPDEQTLATSSEDKDIILWSVPEGQKKHQLLYSGRSFGIVAFSSEGRLFAAGNVAERLPDDNGDLRNSYSIVIWDVATRLRRCELRGHQSTVSALKFSDSGQFFASSAHNERLILWDARNWQQIWSTDVRSWCYALDFSRDEKMLARTSINPSIMIFDIESKQTLREFKSVSNSTVVKFAPNGLTLHTNSGRYDLTPLDSAELRSRPSVDSLYLWDGWVKFGHEDLLWLPLDHLSVIAMIMHDDVFINGQSSGGISFLGFDVSKIPR